MKGTHSLAALFLLALAFSLASAYDPSPLQDFCVAIDEPKSGVFVNGKFCKDPNLVKAEDFSFRGLNVPRDTHNQVGSNVTNVDVNNLAGLNTMGVALARIDYAPFGLNPPHTHPRAAELLMCMEGTLLVGFVTSNPNNTFFSQILHPGDLFLFPFGMIHFQQNIAEEKAVAFSSFSSQFPGTITVANAVFGSNPAINPEVLARAFQLDKKVVKELQQKFWGNNGNYS